MNPRREDIREYLGVVCDETLAEHDKKYHPGGYKEDDKCNKRADMEKEDPADTEVAKKKDAKASVESAKGEEEKVKESLEAWRERARKYLRGITIEHLAELLHKYDDDKHPEEMGVINEEVDRRQNIGIEQYMKNLGERA